MYNCLIIRGGFGPLLAFYEEGFKYAVEGFAGFYWGGPASPEPAHGVGVGAGAVVDAVGAAVPFVVEFVAGKVEGRGH